MGIQTIVKKSNPWAKKLYKVISKKVLEPNRIRRKITYGIKGLKYFIK